MDLDIQNFIKHSMHTYMREILGDAAYIALSFVFVLLGLLFLLIAISNSNAILGNPSYRDKSSLSELEYRKTRTKLRVVLGIVGIVLIIYNVIGAI